MSGNRGLIYADRVQETCSNPGTGTVSLLGAVTGYQTFSSVCVDQQTVYYAMWDNAGNWEVGRGTFSSGADTIARDLVESSSNSGALVNFTASTIDIWLDEPANTTVDRGLAVAFAMCIVPQ